MTVIFSIETSCDETSAAVIKDGREILGHTVASQEAIHAKYGGVFPEVASRKHIEVISPIVTEALEQAQVGWDAIDCIAVTKGPGLVGSLLVGVNMAKGLSLATGIPLLGVNHIEGHIYSQWLADGAEEIEFPLVILVVSGGHTELYLMTDHCEYEHLGGTIDDAAGEAFDKVGRLLGLPYPGGPHIDKAAKLGDPTRFDFPRAIMKDGYNFSFSGLKTAAMREIQKLERAGEDLPINDLAAGFQQAVVDALVIKTGRAVAQTGAKGVHIAGGVSANSQLRREMAERLDVPVRTPPLFLCTDNAAMIGAIAHQRFIRGERSGADMDVTPSWQI